MLSFLPQILIFISLGVIIYIVAKKIPQLREVGRKKELQGRPPVEKTGAMRKLSSIIGGFAKNIFVWFAEGLVRKTKNLLHLVHFWLIKMKRGKKENEMISEIEAKQELIKEEERSLEKVINEDLAQADIAEIAIFKEKRVEQQLFAEEEDRPQRLHTPSALNSPDIPGDASTPETPNFKANTNNILADTPMDDQHKKIEQFFADDSDFDEIETEQELPEQETPEKKKPGFFKRLLKKKDTEDEWKEDIYTFPEDQAARQSGKDHYMEEQYEDHYTDGIVQTGELTEGIVKIEKKPLEHTQAYAEPEARTMNEVVKRRPEEVDPDDEMGVDRKILEQKIIQKIAKNPRDIENYRQLGELYIKMRELADAEESYKQILKISPRDMDAKRKIEKIRLLKRLK